MRSERLAQSSWTRRLCALALLAALDAAAAGATCTWTGAAGDDRWVSAANWSPALPTAADDAVLPPGTTVRVDDGSACATLRCEGDAALEGSPLRIARSLRAEARRVAIACPLVLGAGAELHAAAGARIAITAAVELAGEAVLTGDGETRLAASVGGDGGVTVRGPGRVEFVARSTYRGPTRLLGGEAWVQADVPAEAEADGGFGRSAEPVALDGGCLVLDTPRFARGIAVGEAGGRIDARSEARTLDGDLLASAFRGGGLLGTYIPTSLRGSLEDDWRERPDAKATRLDPRIHFPAGGFGRDRRKLGIGGRDDDWENFSIQWDGWLRVHAEGATLATASDDGSRVWLDLDGDSAIDADEWGSNGWGSGQGTTVRPVHSRLPAGTYRIRVQYEEGNGGNAMALLWDDAAHADGAFSGMHVVASSCLLRANALELGGDDYGESRGKPLTLAGRIVGAGVLRKVGASVLTIAAAADAPYELRVEGGVAVVAGDSALPAGSRISVAARGRCRAQVPLRLSALGGEGVLALEAPLVVTSGVRVAFPGTVEGAAELTFDGGGELALGGTVRAPVRAVEGTITFADARMLTAAKLRGPLTTILALPAGIAGGRVIVARLDVPADAPADLGWGVCASDRHGRWFQRLCGSLGPGVTEARIELPDDAALQAEPWSTRWVAAAPIAARTGLFFWSAGTAAGTVSVDARVERFASGSRVQPRLTDLRMPSSGARTGQRLEWRVGVDPFPSNPYDPDEFALDAVLTAPDGAELRVPAFFRQGQRLRDRGDREEAIPDGDEGFVVRFRPRVPGEYRVRLEARWRGRASVTSALPPLTVAGDPWDPYVRVDAGDHRFFSAGGAFVWPNGLNIRSVNDVRCRGALGTVLTPDRGTLAYAAYLDRLSAAGGDACEIWMAAWNLGLEWRADWSGFHGVGRYNQENAARLDAVLDHAWSRGVRINLVINNHGQASEGADREWEHSPYNKRNGGRLAGADAFFHDPWALRWQEAYRRYIVARWADHPAVLGWKLFSEINLTRAGEHVVPWHVHAAERWHQLDVYDHPTTTHWAGDYHSPDRRVVALPGIQYVCIDAYHGGNRLLAELISDGVCDPRAGLGTFGKPVLVTEFGGSSGGTAAAAMQAELASGAWAGFVSGNAGAPMLWWYEFVDQRELWQPFGAIRRFATGEDLRGADAASVALAAHGTGSLWGRAWRRPTRWLGYVIDREWGTKGGDGREHPAARVDLGAVDAGAWNLAWWDADAGRELSRLPLSHTGGPLTLEAPPFRKHLAFKLWRAEGTAR